MSGPVISAGWVGRVIDGRFALHEWLGGAESSGIFRTDLPQPVVKRTAIKLIAAEGARADAYLAGWAKVANLAHPHLIRVFRSGRYQFGSIGMVYVVMECADEVLAQILPERALTSDETREMLGPVIDALRYLHEKGFVHGHLKPSNILVVDDQVKLSGENVAAGGLRNRFEPLSPYDAPEAASALTAASDVWSLGMLLVETLTQRTPAWDRTSRREPVLPDGMPRAFAEIARECLRVDPAARCSLEEIKARLEPNKPLAFPGAKEGKAVPVAPVASGSAEDSEEPAEGRLALPTMRVVPLVLGLAVVIAIIAVLTMRGHGKQNATVGANQENAPAQVAPAAPSSDAERAPVQAVPTPAETATHGTNKGDVLGRKMPEVAAQARRTIHGTVTVAVKAEVDANGKVAETSFKSEGPSKYFARVALEAARGWTFKPAEKNGEAVPSRWVLRFKFRERGDEATAVEERP